MDRFSGMFASRVLSHSFSLQSVLPFIKIKIKTAVDGSYFDA